MVVGNPCINDTRVIKEAEALAIAGYRVVVLCARHPGIADQERSAEGVEYYRVEMNNFEERAVDLPWLLSTVLFALKLLQRVASTVSFARNLLNRVLDRVAPIAAAGAKAVAARLRQKSLRNWIMVARRFAASHLINWLRYRCIAAEVARIRPHLIHVHDLAPLPAAARAARAAAVPLVYDAHELETHRNGSSAFNRWLAWLAERRYVGQVAAVITVSDSIADHLARTYRITRPLVVLNSPDIDRAPPPSSSDVRAACHLGAETPLAVYVGKVTIGRGLEQLVDALRYWPDGHVALLGPRVESVTSALRLQAETLGVLARLHFVDSVAPNAVVSFIRGADLGVIPIQDVCLSYRYAMPNKLFEMLLAGLPIAVADLPEMRAVVQRERVGAVMDQTDPQAIARALAEVYARRAALRPEPARFEQLVRLYAWAPQAEKLFALYRRLLPVAA